MKPATVLTILSCFICFNWLPRSATADKGGVIETSKDGWAIAESTNANIYPFSAKSRQERKASESSKVRTVAAKTVDSLKSEPSTNIRCIAEPADTKSSSDSNPVPVIKATEKPQYARAVAISEDKGNGATLSLLPLKLTLANIPEIAFLKRSPLSEASATAVSAAEAQKSEKEKQYITIPDNLFIPLDIGVGIALQQKDSKQSPVTKSFAPYKSAQSSEPKISYSNRHVTKKQGFRPFPKFSHYHKYGEKNYEANNYAPSYSFHDHGSKSNDGSYRSQHKSFNPSELRFYQEKAKVMASEDNAGCRTVIKEIKDLPGRIKRGADEPRVIIMTKECYHPSDKAGSVKIPATKQVNFHNSYDNRDRSVRPSVRHYDSTQHTPTYAYHGHDFYHSPSRDTSYTYSDPYHYSGSSHYPHNHNYGQYHFYPSYHYGQRRAGQHNEEEEEAGSHHHDKHDHHEPRSEKNEENYHPGNRDDSHHQSPKETHHRSSSEKVDKRRHHEHDHDHHGHHDDHHHHKDHDHHHHGQGHHKQHHRDHDHHHRDQGHRHHEQDDHKHAKNSKPTPKTVTRSFSYYRKDKDNGKDPHNHEEGEEYAQGNYRSYSTSYDSKRDGPK